MITKILYGIQIFVVHVLKQISHSCAEDNTAFQARIQAPWNHARSNGARLLAHSLHIRKIAD